MWGRICSKPASSLSFLGLKDLNDFVLCKRRELFLILAPTSKKEMPHSCLISLSWRQEYTTITQPCGSFGPKADKLLAGLEQILPHKKTLLRVVPIKGIVRFLWQFLRLTLTARVCYPKGHASTTTTHTHYGTPFLRPSAYKARVGGISPQYGIEQICAGGSKGWPCPSQSG